MTNEAKDQVSEWAWDAAGEAIQPWLGTGNQYRDDCQEQIAYALLAAERRGIERAAEVADELPRCELVRCSPEVTAERAFKTGADAQARSIADAIRQLGLNAVEGREDE